MNKEERERVEEGTTVKSSFATVQSTMICNNYKGMRRIWGLNNAQASTFYDGCREHAWHSIDCSPGLEVGSANWTPRSGETEQLGKGVCSLSAR
jgi:hypothetical protein